METGVNSVDLLGMILGLISTWGLKLIGAIVALILGRIAAGWVRRAMRRVLERSRIDETLVPFLASLAYHAALAFVIIAVLGIVGIETASLAIVLGAASLALGLALQGTLSNFASGVMLMVFRPIKLGDWVEVGGVAGSVAEIGIFSTKLNTGDNVHIVIPNSNIYGAIIRNYSVNETRRVDLTVGIHYDDDIGLAITTLQKILNEDERVLDEPEPVIVVSELADSSVKILARPWCVSGDYWRLRCDLTRKFKEELEKAGCSIPFPQQDVHLYSSEAVTG